MSQQYSEIEKLKTANSKLESTLQELKLEISYYKGEVKRLEWEKSILNQDIGRMSLQFKNWIDQLQVSSTKPPVTSSTFLCKSIADILQVSETTSIFVTSCQPPFYIEYANKKWSDECGWVPSDILGLTCSFLQGELTDKKTCDLFMSSIREIGCATMRIVNYRKCGDPFEVTVTVYPVFDSSSPEGPDSEVAVLTHFVSIMTDIVPFTTSNLEVKEMYDRRGQSKKYDPKFYLSAENFFRSGNGLRLSNLLRLMLSSHSALVLTDKDQRIVHVNSAWCQLTGYEITDVEGKKCNVLNGPESDRKAIDDCRQALVEFRPYQMTLINYRKNGEKFMNKVIIVPIRGGYLNSEVTHFFGLCIEESSNTDDNQAQTTRVAEEGVSSASSNSREYSSSCPRANQVSNTSSGNLSESISSSSCNAAVEENNHLIQNMDQPKNHHIHHNRDTQPEEKDNNNNNDDDDNEAVDKEVDNHPKKKSRKNEQ